MATGVERRYKILLVEDNPADAKVLQLALRQCEGPGKGCDLQWLMNSTDVIPFLRSPERTSDIPNLIILDYRLPTNGGRALAELKGDPNFRHIPVLVLTGSQSPKDFCDVYRRDANCCYHKPSDYDEYAGLVQVITQHWLSKICIPNCPLE
jgi:two-component system, chemotaxis family, response regulator Rcp1